MSKNCAIIVAGGKGKRMGKKINKQFLYIRNKPILYYTLKAFSDHSLIDDIIIAASSSEIDYIKREIVQKYNLKKIKAVVEGGKERQDSVFNALKAVKKYGDYDIVVIHDGARPFVDSYIIEQGIHYAGIYGSAACGVKPKDTIKMRDIEGYSINTLDRNILFSVQTPQCFNYNLIMKCHEELKIDNVRVTDDTAVVENYGNKVYLYEGSYNNIKITTPEDMIIAERILEELSIDRV